MKARFLALAALVLGLASCQTDPSDLNVDWGGEQDAVVTVALPADATRSAGADSALGAIGNIDMSEYDIRFILEVYDANGDLAKERIVNRENDATSTSFSIRLVPGRDYKFVAWADFIPQTQADNADYHYNTTNLANIQLSDDSYHHPMDESRDAYTKAEVFTYNSTANISLTLTRPFAKLRVVTTDMNELYSKLTYATVKYSTKLYTAFNAIDEAVVEDSLTGNISKAANLAGESFIYSSEPKDGQMTLFADYFFGAEGDKVLFTLDVDDDTNETIPTIVFNTNIPVERNYLTTVMGPILTDANTVTVVINPAFDEPENVENAWNGKVKEPAKNDENQYVVVEASELAWLAAAVNGTLPGDTRAAEKKTFNGETIVLTKDINLNYERWTPIGANGKFEGTFDGQGHTITNLVVKSTDKTPAGLFANAKYVKNVNVKNATIEGHYKSGVIVGDGLCSRITNCHVDGATVTVTPLNNDDANHAGGIVGYLSAENEAYVKNCSVQNATISAYRDVAGIAGTANQAAVVSGNTVKDVVVIADQATDYKEVKAANAGEVVGRIHAKATVEGNTVENVNVAIQVVTADKLEYIANNTAGDVYVVFGGDIAGNATIKQRENVNVVIDGRNKKFDGVITVNGDARANGREALTFKNICFETEGNDFTFISAPSKIDNRYNYTHNVTIEGCTFKANHTVGCASFTGTYNFVMKDCKANNVHSIAQFQSVDNTVLVEKIEVTNSKNGISFGNTAFPTLKSATINAAEYGVRADGNASRGNLVIEDAVISAKLPVIVRKTTTAGYTVDLEGATLNASGYHVVFTKNSDDATFVAPEVAFAVNGADGLMVFPTTGTAATTGIVYNAEELAAALNGSVSEIKLQAGEYGTIVAKSNKTIIGTAGAKVDAIALNSASNLTLKNINFDAATAQGSYDGNGKLKTFGNIISGTADFKTTAAPGANIVIENCTFTGEFANGGAAFVFSNQNRSTYGKVTIKGCTFETKNGYYDIYGHYFGMNNLVIENNTFKSTNLLALPIYLGRYQSNMPVELKNNQFTVASLDDAIAYQAHSDVYTVSVDASGNTFAN